MYHVEGRGNTFAIVDENDEEVAEVTWEPVPGVAPILTASGKRATMFAAAPNLLAALETLTKMVEDGDWPTVELKEARAAIAQAKGQ